jgi:hypothetical protein
MSTREMVLPPSIFIESCNSASVNDNGKMTAVCKVVACKWHECFCVECRGVVIDKKQATARLIP